MSFTQDLADGLCQYLSDAGIGSYSTEVPYTDADTTVITAKRLPESPDRAVAVTIYPVQANTAGADVLLGAQVRTRGTAGDDTDVDHLADDIYELLHGAESLTFNGIHVPFIWHQSGALLGFDQQPGGRGLRSDNYYLRAAHGTAVLI